MLCLVFWVKFMEFICMLIMHNSRKLCFNYIIYWHDSYNDVMMWVYCFTKFFIMLKKDLQIYLTLFINNYSIILSQNIFLVNGFIIT